MYHWEFNKSNHPVPPVPPSPPSPGVSLFENGIKVSGYFCHRVPGAVNTGESIVVFVESRHNSCADQEPKDVTMRRSTDGGLTWGAPTRVLGDTVLTNDTRTFRNPSPLHHTARNGSNSLILNVVNSTENATGRLGFGRFRNLQLKSFDDGLSWSAPQPIVMGKFDGVLSGPGAGIQLGRHSIANRRNSTLSNRILFSGDGVVWYSDDDGVVWHVSPSYFPQVYESQLVELNNGSIMQNFRQKGAKANRTCKCRGYSMSHDGGQSWTEPSYEPQLIAPECSAGLINVAPAASAESTLFFSNPADEKERVKMTVRRSDDEGSTWRRSKLVWPGLTGYSVLVPINGTHIGAFFENGE
jgi:sialidase-1